MTGLCPLRDLCRVWAMARQKNEVQEIFCKSWPDDDTCRESTAQRDLASEGVSADNTILDQTEPEEGYGSSRDPPVSRPSISRHLWRRFRCRR